MNKRNGIDTLADKNSPSITWRMIRHSERYTRVDKLTIDKTIIGKTGREVLADSPGAKALGIGGLSEGLGEAVSSSLIFLHG